MCAYLLWDSRCQTVLLWLLLYSISNRVILYHATLEYEVSPKLSDNGQTQGLPDSMNYPWVVWHKVITPLFREREKKKKKNRARLSGRSSSAIRFTDPLWQLPAGWPPRAPSALHRPHQAHLNLKIEKLHQSRSVLINRAVAHPAREISDRWKWPFNSSHKAAVSQQTRSSPIQWPCHAITEK